MINKFTNKVSQTLIPVIPVLSSSNENGYKIYIGNELSNEGYKLFDNDSNTYVSLLKNNDFSDSNENLIIEIPESLVIKGISFKLTRNSVLKKFYILSGDSNEIISYYDFNENHLTHENGFIFLEVENQLLSNKFIINIPKDNGEVSFSEFQLYKNKELIGLQQVKPRQIKSSTIHYKNLENQMEKMKEVFQEDFYPFNGQKNITIGTNYKIGNKTLTVYKNGIIQSPEEDYIEIDGKSIEFIEPLEYGDWILVRIEGSGNGTLLENTIHITENPIGEKDGENRIFELQYYPERKTESVFLNGILMSEGLNEDYQINGKTIIFEFAPIAGSKITVNYMPLIYQLYD